MSLYICTGPLWDPLGTLRDTLKAHLTHRQRHTRQLYDYWSQLLTSSKTATHTVAWRWIRDHKAVLSRNKERHRERRVKYVWDSMQCVSVVMMSPSESFYLEHTVIREKLLWPHEGWRMVRGFFSFQLHLCSYPSLPPSCPNAPYSGNYVTCILIFPSDIQPSQRELNPSLGLQLMTVSIIDYPVDYLCNSLIDC